MPKKRPYDQYCPIATALDRVGDRWTLLIVRELTVGPMRYGELRVALDGISTDVLANRLREMEVLGLVTSADGGYALTAEGQDLAPVLRALGGWGSRHLAPPTDADQLSARRVVQMLAVSGASPAGVGSTPASAELRADGEVWTIETDGSRNEVRRGPATDPDAVVTTTGPTLWGLPLGTTDWSAAVDDGRIDIEGDEAAAARLLGPLLFGS